MASSIDRRVACGPRSYKITVQKRDISTNIVKNQNDINLNSTSILRSSVFCGTLLRTPSSPSIVSYETAKFSNKVKAEPVASPTTCLFDSLTLAAQQVPSPPHSALTDTVVDAIKMDAPDWSPLPADLFEVDPFPESTASVNFFDEQPAVFSGRHDQDRVQLDTPQPLFNDAPQPWSYPSVSSDVQQQQNETTPTSISILNLDSLTGEELNRLIAETETNSVDDQAVFAEQHVQQQQPVENGPSVDPLLDHDYVESDDQILAEFLDTTKGFFQGNSLDSQIVMGGETVSNEDVPSFMNSTIDLEPWIEQLPNDEDQIYDEEAESMAMSNASAEEMVDSPSTSRSSSVVQRAGPYTGAYRDRRDRNNEASRKSRAKRNARFNQMKEELDELTSRNKHLHADVARLEDIKNEWKERLLQMMSSR
uniref:BZIP domain-containing protein n=1 Tax=Plectus sambesii TaxID=2011161 RepID=A0A914X8H5_9BILA